MVISVNKRDILKLHISPGNQKILSDLVQGFSALVCIRITWLVGKGPQGALKQITRLSKSPWSQNKYRTKGTEDKKFVPQEGAKTKHTTIYEISPSFSV